MRFASVVLSIVLARLLCPALTEAADLDKTVNQILAQTPPQTVANQSGPVLLPIDELETLLFQRPKMDAAERAARAFSALERRAWALARALAGGVQKTERYSDYGYWIAGQVALREGEERLGKPPGKSQAGYKSALKLASEARRLFRQIEIVNPYSPFIRQLQKDIGLADLLSARAQGRLEKWHLAIDQYESGFQRLGAGALAEISADALTGFGLACQKSPSELCKPWSRRLASVFVKGTEEAKVLARFFPESSVRIKAPSFDTKTRAYRAPDLDLTAFDSAMNLYWAQEYKSAAEAFQKFLDEFPRSTYRFRARYWWAQTLKKRNDSDHARAVLLNLQLDSPLTYYGLLASTETGLDLDRSIGATLPVGTLGDLQLHPDEQTRLARAEELIRVGGGALAVLELRDLKPRAGLSSPFLAYLLLLDTLAGNHAGSFAIASELLARGYEGLSSSYGLRVIFPTPYLELIQKYSREIQLDPLLVLSLVKQESSFGGDAVSSSGALGLMQLMPATAFETMPGVARMDLQRAEANLRVGTAYLRQLMIRFKGNIIMSLAGYNAGPNAADRWFKQLPADRSVPELIESIPYRETREYVAAIIRNHYWYSKRLGMELRSIDYYWKAQTPPASNAK